MAQREKLPRGFYWQGRIIWCRTCPITHRSRSTKCSDLEAALEVHRQWQRAAANPANQAAETATLGDWVDAYVEDREFHGLSTDFAEQKLGTVLAMLGRDYPIKILRDPKEVNRYIGMRKALGCVNHGIVKELGQLRLVLRLAARHGAYDGDPNLLIPDNFKKKYKPRETALTHDEVRRLLAACNPPLAALVARIVAYSCSLGEVYKTTIDADGVATIRGTKAEKRARLVPLLPTFEYLSNLASQKPHAYNNARRDLLAACRRAGVPECTPNDLRRTFATLLREAGVPREIVAAFMGHSGTAMLERVYDRARLSELAEQAKTALRLASAEKRHSSPAENDETGYATQDSNLWPSAPEADALSS